MYPKPVLDVINPAVHDTLVQVHATDPGPAAPAPPRSARYPEGTQARDRGPLSHRDRSPATIPAPQHRVRPAVADAAGLRRGRSSACWSRRSCPAHLRRPIHIALTLGGLAGAFVLTIVVAAAAPSSPTAARGTSRRWARSAVDRPTLFIQGTILVLAFVSVLLIADSSHDGQPVRGPGGRRARQRRGARGPAGRDRAHRGLPADPVRGGRHAAVPGGQRPAHHVRRARSAVPAAVPAVRAGPAPPAAVAGSGHEVLPARRVLLGVLPVRRGHAVRLRRLGVGCRPSRRRQPATSAARRCCTPGSRCSASACCSRSARCRSRAGSPTSTRARRPR